MLNRSASLAMSTCILRALPGKLDIKKHSPSILYVLQGYRTSRKFITAQSPLPSTIVDFLSLIYQEKCSCIVMMDEADTADKVGILPAE